MAGMAGDGTRGVAGEALVITVGGTVTTAEAGAGIAAGGGVMVGIAGGGIMVGIAGGGIMAGIAGGGIMADTVGESSTAPPSNELVELRTALTLGCSHTCVELFTTTRK
jgi:hypothetical protein